jgi:hypothetical protein
MASAPTKRTCMERMTMGERAPILNSGTVAWLLEGGGPPVRHLMPTELLGEPARGAEADAQGR